MKRFSNVLASMLLVGVLLVASMSLFAAEEYRYDFSQVADGALPEGFHVFAGNWRVEDGTLVGSAANFEGGQIVFGDPGWADYEVEATITYVQFNNAARWAAMMYRGQQFGGAPFQLFTVRQGSTAHNGAELAQRTPADAWDVPLTVSLATDRELGKGYRFKIVIQGPEAKYYIDDELIIQSNTLVKEKKGTLGFMVDGGTITVEDVVVRVIK